LLWQHSKSLIKEEAFSVNYKARKEPKEVVLAKFDRRYPYVLGVSAMAELRNVKKEERPLEQYEDPQPPVIPEY